MAQGVYISPMIVTTEGPTPVFKRFGGNRRTTDGRNIYVLFSIVSHSKQE